MRKYYAYKPTADNKEPMGTANRSLFKLKTDGGAILRAQQSHGPTAKVYQYTNVYDGRTFRRVI